MIANEKLCALLISDLHSDIYALDNLRLKLKDKKFDFVLISGDIIDLSNEDVTNPQMQ